MPEFTYEALSQDAVVMRGRIAAQSVSAAVAALEAQGLVVTSIQQAALPTEAALTADKHPTAQETASSAAQQALQQRITKALEKRDVLAPALTAFAEELPPGRSRRELTDLVTRLRAGATTDSFSASDDPAAAWLLLLGRPAGSTRLLSDLFVEATRDSESQTQWNRALIYPLFVFLGSLAVLLFLCVAVVPTFTSIFDDFQLDLPQMTVGVVSLSNRIVRTPLRFAMEICAGVAGLVIVVGLLRSSGFLGWIGHPLTMGSSWQVTTMARFTRRLAEALDVGLELPNALRLAGQTDRRKSMRRLAIQLAEEAEHENFDLQKSAVARRLPTTVIHALRAGLDNRPNIPLLRQLAEVYTTRVRQRHNWSTGFAAHIAIVGMGLTVGFVVLALFIPLVELINGLTG